MSSPTAPREIRTSRLVLTPPTRGDVATMTGLCQDPQIREWTIVPSPYRSEHAQEFLTQVVDPGWASGTELTWAMRLPHPRPAALIGMIALSGRDASSGEVGYWIGPRARGQGYTGEALRAVVDVAFDTLGLQRLHWSAFVGNYASAAVARSGGFRFEGTARLGGVQREVRRDSWWAGLLTNDPRPGPTEAAAGAWPCPAALATWPAQTWPPGVSPAPGGAC